MKFIAQIAVASALLVSAQNLAADIAGVWKIDDQPAWVEIDIDAETAIATGTVRRHEDRPQAVGRVILRDLRRVEDDVWAGQIYVARMDSFRNARIGLSGTDSLAIEVRVGFMSRTVSWSRADEVPAD